MLSRPGCRSRLRLKNSETFRKIVDTTFDAVSGAIRWFWNNVGQPVFQTFVEAIGAVIGKFADMVEGMSKVPGFGWLKPVAAGMHAAADGTDRLADSIKKIPDRKTVNIDVVVNQAQIDKVKQQLGDIRGRMSSGGKGGSGGKGDDWGGDAGATLIGNIVSGIKKHKIKLDTALEQVKSYIADKMDKLQTLLDKRNAVVDSFKGMTSSVFSADLSVGEGDAPAGIQRVLDFGSQMRDRAQSLLANVQSLIAKGLSRDLIQQLMGAGESGQDQIALLAGGTAEQIAQANADNLATQQALQAAGMEASKALGIEEDIRAAERDLQLAETIKAKMNELLAQQDKNTIVVLRLDGKDIQVSLKKLKRQNGGVLGLGDSDRD